MHPAFANIQFGPFASTYHREAVNDQFREALSVLLEAELLPQVEQPYESTTGQLTASYDDQKYCGPLSVVRNIYCLAFAFHRPSGDDTIEDANLVFEPKTQAFRTPTRDSLYLWTASRQQRYQQGMQAIKELCGRILAREQYEAVCPMCSAALCIRDCSDMFDARCPEGCFKFNYHRDPTTGELLHGHFFPGVKPPR
ncbi:MAG: hypothetical protein WC713_06370 [Candidatus Methylomirabilota bacterium]